MAFLELLLTELGPGPDGNSAFHSLNGLGSKRRQQKALCRGCTREVDKGSGKDRNQYERQEDALAGTTSIALFAASLIRTTDGAAPVTEPVPWITMVNGTLTDVLPCEAHPQFREPSHGG